MTAREARRKVLVRSRMKADTGWVDVCIHNMSSRGLMAAADDAPAPGAYVDIRRGRHVIIGRTVWRKGRFFGVRTQDKLPIDAIVGEPVRQDRPPAGNAQVERRGETRLQTEARMARRLERSRQMSSVLQFGLLAVASIGGALLIGQQVYDVLARPLAAVEAKLSPAG